MGRGTRFDEAFKREAMVKAEGSRNVEIITYDELFKKLDILANLFNLVRKSST